MPDKTDLFESEFTTPAGSQKPEQKSRGRKWGCLGCLGVLIAVPLTLMGVGYYVLFHTSVPLKMMVSEDFDINGKPVELRGLSGSISNGFAIEEIVVHDDLENTVIEGLTFHYSGLWDSIFNNRFVIEELSADRSVFIVSDDFFSGSVTEDNEEEQDDRAAAEATDGIKSEFVFELRELNFRETSFKSADGEIDIKIPLVRLTGLKIDANDASLAELEVVSDFLDLELVDAEPVEIDGQALPFQQKVTGIVYPKIHPLIISEIDFSFEFAAVKGRSATRMSAFNGQMQNISFPDGTTHTQFDHFSLGKFVDPTGYIVPERFSFHSSEVKKIMTVGPGEFFLGKTRFEVKAQEINTSSSDAVLVSQAEINGQKFEATLQPVEQQVWPPFRIEIKSEQKLNAKQQLSLVYFHSTYNELTPEQKFLIDDFVTNWKKQALKN